jgi:PqqD family protein of HPr-rel-A system
MLAGPANESTLWTSKPEVYHIEPHEEAWYAYHYLSGETHLLNFLSFEILLVLQENTVRIDDLSQVIRDRLGFVASECPNSLIDQTVKELDSAGLVTPSNGKALKG